MTVQSPSTVDHRVNPGDPPSAEPSPAVTWVAFETAPEPVLHDSLRVPQGNGDIKGALFDLDIASSQSPAELAAEGKILDLCRLDDLLVEKHWPSVIPDVRALAPAERHELARSLLGRDCRGPEIAAVKPLLGYSASRYRVFGTHGLERTYFRSRDEAAAWYEQHVAERQTRYENTLPPGAEQFGSFGYPIEYSSHDNPIDEVRVLAETVSVTEDALRGLVRNWSRTLWAYGVIVQAEGREFSWPLTIQPGEAAPFEIGGWAGPSDPSQFDISVIAEMSNDADISRSWWMLPFPQIIEPGDWRTPPPPEVLGELPAEAAQLIATGAYYDDPDSHPSLHGEFAESVDFELAAFVALFDGDGTVIDVHSPIPYSNGRWLLPPADGVLPAGAKHSADAEGRVDYLPFIVRRYPVPELGVRQVAVLFDGTAGVRWAMWIGAGDGAPAS
jgi:hypothetical protein